MSIARLMQPPAGEDFVIRDAVIREWNADTFENVVEYEGQLFRNLEVSSGASIEAMTYGPGVRVELEGWFPGGRRGELGIGTYRIKGRVIKPGTGAAEQAIAFMQTALGSAVAAGVFAARVHVDHVATQETTTSSTFTDLTTVGPTVADVPISATGVAIVHLSCLAEANTIGSTSSAVSGDMGFAVSGATTVAAGANQRWLSVGHFDNTNDTSASLQLGITLVIDGLNEGDHTFTAKYRRVQGSNAYPFANRTMVVIGL